MNCLSALEMRPAESKNVNKLYFFTYIGVALTGDPDYRIVMEAYPFVTRKIISDESPALQRALRDILYT